MAFTLSPLMASGNGGLAALWEPVEDGLKCSSSCRSSALKDMGMCGTPFLPLFSIETGLSSAIVFSPTKMCAKKTTNNCKIIKVGRKYRNVHGFIHVHMFIYVFIHVDLSII